MSEICSLYCDGGVIGHNPSSIGGTYAFRLLNKAEVVIREYSSVVLPLEIGIGPTVSNNQTEMLALLYALRSVSYQFAGTVYSDSQVTLGRVFMGWKWTNIPPWMHRDLSRPIGAPGELAASQDTCSWTGIRPKHNWQPASGSAAIQ